MADWQSGLVHSLFVFWVPHVCPRNSFEGVSAVRSALSLHQRCIMGPSTCYYLPHPCRLVVCDGRFDRFNPLMRGTQQLGNLGIPTAQVRVHLCNCFSRLLGQYSAEGSVCLSTRGIESRFQLIAPTSRVISSFCVGDTR